MTLERTQEYLLSLLRELTKLPNETEWVEFKSNNDPEPTGEYISALANSAALIGKQLAYMVWGIENETHEVIGTNFTPSTTTYKQQELESWLLQKLVPKIHFRFYEFVASNEKPVKASYVIRDAIKSGVIRAYDPSVGQKSRRYVPFWT